MSKDIPTVRRAVIAKNFSLLQVSYVAFLILLTVKTLIWPPADKLPNVTIFVIQLLPLSVFLYGIFTNKRKHIASMCYVLLMYFITIGANMFSPLADIYTWLSLALIAVIYTTSLMHVRWTREGVLVTD